MTLRKKTIYLLIAGSILLILALVLSSKVLVLRGFTDLEVKNIEVHLERWNSEIANSLSRLNTIARDWGPWDDTYQFMEGVSANYITSNLSTETLLNLGINFMLFVDSSGEIKFSRFLDLATGKDVPPSESILSSIADSPFLSLAHNTPVNTRGITGIVMAGERPVLAAAQPILKSDFSGPTRGSLVVGRYLDDAEIQRISETTHLSFSIQPVTASDMPPDFRKTLPLLSGGTPVVVQMEGFSSISGYAMAADAHGNPAFMVKVQVPRKIYIQGLKTFYYYSLVIISVGLVFGLLILFFLGKLVLYPLSRLSDEVSEIGKSGDTGARITLIRNDELGRLAAEINRMLDQIHKKTLDLSLANEDLKKEVSERKQAQAMIAESERQLREQSRVIMAISRIKFLETGDLRAAIQKVTEAAAPTLGVERVGVWLKKDYLTEECVDLYLLSRGRHLAGMKLQSADYPDYFKAIREARIIAANDARSDPRTREFAEPHLLSLGITSLLHSPIRISGQTVGVVSFEHIGPCRTWTLEEQSFAASVADIISLIMESLERRLAEEEKKGLEIRLQRAEKMEAIGMLAGGVAHDLNNILSGLVSYPDLLLMKIPENSDLRKPLSIIKQAGERAGAVVQDLLTLSRRGATTLDVVSLNRVVSEYLKSFEYEQLRSRYPGVEIETSLESNLLNIMGSWIHLSKTLMNLVLNAAEAMPEGGKIRVSTRNHYADTPMEGYDRVAEGEYAVLAVADTGVGISESDRSRIFEPFYTKKVMGRSGTGLGLAVVWGTVKDLKGYIDVQPGRPKGTVFSLYFPATRKSAPGPRPPVSIESYRGKGETILVVDDVAEQREIATDMMKELGYNAVAVASGEEAVNWLHGKRVDLVVLDMIMDPGMDGLDTYRRILEILPGQKAIITSGFSESDRVKEAMRLGAGPYVKKPYNLETLGMAIRKALE